MYQDWMEYIPIFGPIMQKCPHCGWKINSRDVWCIYCAEKVR